MNYYIKATTEDNKTELFNLNKILSISKRENGMVKILMGAGLYWDVYADSIEYIDCINDLIKEAKGSDKTGGGIKFDFEKIFDDTGLQFDNVNDILSYMHRCAEYLATDNENYTHKQFRKIHDIFDILNCRE